MGNKVIEKTRPVMGLLLWYCATTREHQYIPSIVTYNNILRNMSQELLFLNV